MDRTIALATPGTGDFDDFMRVASEGGILLAGLGDSRTRHFLARVDRANPRWSEIAQDVVYACTLDDSMDSDEWASFLRPVREQLFPQFLAVFDKKERGAPARIAATFLAEHWRDDPTRLLPLILAADGEQLGRLLRPAARIAPVIRNELVDACRPPKPDVCKPTLNSRRHRAPGIV